MPSYRISHKKIHNQLNAFALESIDEFCRFVNEKLESSSREIEMEQEKFAEDSEKEDEHYRFLYEGKLDSDMDTLGGIYELAGQLSVLSLNHQAENRTKAILKSHNAKNRIQLVYENFVSFKELLERTKQIEIYSLEGAHAVNEVRLVSNSIKHNDGRVSKTLAEGYPHREEGTELTGLMDLYTEKAKLAGQYLDALVEKLIEDRQDV